METSTLPVGGSVEVAHSFSTSGLAAGVYRLELHAAGDFGGVSYDMELSRVDVEVLAFDLAGVLATPAEVVAGSPLAVTGTVDNLSTGELVDAELSLLLVDSADGSLVFSYLDVVTLPVGGTVEIGYSFETIDLDPGTYRVELLAAGDFGGVSYDLELARAEVKLLGGVVIPTLGPSLLLLLAALLAVTGVVVLRRRPMIDLENAEMSANHESVLGSAARRPCRSVRPRA